MSTGNRNDAAALLERLASNDVTLERVRLHMERLDGRPRQPALIHRALMAAARDVRRAP